MRILANLTEMKRHGLRQHKLTCKDMKERATLQMPFKIVLWGNELTSSYKTPGFH